MIKPLSNLSMFYADMSLSRELTPHETLLYKQANRTLQTLLKCLDENFERQYREMTEDGRATEYREEEKKEDGKEGSG